jgi:hypothetical protein
MRLYLYFIIFNLVLPSASAAFFEEDEFAWKVPAYCTQERGEYELMRILGMDPCADLGEATKNSDGTNVDFMKAVDTYLDWDVKNIVSTKLKTDLYQLNMRRMLKTEADAIRMFPDLYGRRYGKMGEYGRTKFYAVRNREPRPIGKDQLPMGPIENDPLLSCLRENNAEILEYAEELNNDLNANIPNRIKNPTANYGSVAVEVDPAEKAKQEENKKLFLANLIMKAVKSDAHWDEKISKEERVKKLEDQNESKQNQIFRQFCPASGMERRNCGIPQDMIDRSTAQYRTEIAASNVEIESLKGQIHTLAGHVFSDPMLYENTGTFSSTSQKFNRSKLMNTVIKEIDKLNVTPEQARPLGVFERLTTKGKSIWGSAERDIPENTVMKDNILSMINSGKDEDLVGMQTLLVDLLSENPSFFDEVNTAAKGEMEEEVDKMDSAMEQMCDNQGEDLHHYNGLVNEVLSVYESNLPDDIDVDLLRQQIEKGHCELLDQVPHDDHSAIAYGAGGAVLLGSALLFTPVGWVGGLAAAGTILASAGAVETYRSNKIVTTGEGLSAIGRLDTNEVLQLRQAVRTLRQNVSMTALDAVLIPLDGISIVTKLGQLAKVGKAHVAADVINVNRVRFVEMLDGASEQTVYTRFVGFFSEPGRKAEDYRSTIDSLYEEGKISDALYVSLRNDVKGLNLVDAERAALIAARINSQRDYLLGERILGEAGEGTEAERLTIHLAKDDVDPFNYRELIESLHDEGKLSDEAFTSIQEAYPGLTVTLADLDTITKFDDIVKYDNAATSGAPVLRSEQDIAYAQQIMVFIKRQSPGKSDDWYRNEFRTKTEKGCSIT